MPAKGLVQSQDDRLRRRIRSRTVIIVLGPLDRVQDDILRSLEAERRLVQQHFLPSRLDRRRGQTMA